MNERSVNESINRSISRQINKLSINRQINKIMRSHTSTYDDVPVFGGVGHLVGAANFRVRDSTDDEDDQAWTGLSGRQSCLTTMPLTVSRTVKPHKHTLHGVHISRSPVSATLRFNSTLQCGRCFGHLHPHNPR